ncbi:hypothetical protein ACFLWU_06370 [Chloroflexota bacterium]
MGKRDFGHRETKKAKRDIKKLPQISEFKTPTNVEVVKKVRKKEDEAE